MFDLRGRYLSEAVGKCHCMLDPSPVLVSSFILCLPLILRALLPPLILLALLPPASCLLPPEGTPGIISDYRDLAPYAWMHLRLLLQANEAKRAAVRVCLMKQALLLDQYQ